MNNETLQTASEWTTKTEQLLKARIDKFNIKGKGLLKNSIKASLKTQDKKITITVQLKQTGKFADMGAGRGQKANTKTTARKQKKWLNKFLYARMYQLQRVVGIQVKEEIKRVWNE